MRLAAVPQGQTRLETGDSFTGVSRFFVRELTGAHWRGRIATGAMGRTVVCGDFEWDEEKARANIKKHGISFYEATEAFRDPDFLEFRDERHSTQNEERIKGVGAVRGMVIVATIFTERKRVRIISARKANKKEERDYYERKYGY